MTCLEVRERLPEHGVGLLAGEERRRVERHLEWCAGCRKEVAEFEEAAAGLAMSLPPAEPPPALEDRVARRVAAAAGRSPDRNRRRTMRALAATTMAAAMVAAGAMGWGLAERRQAEDAKQRVTLVQRQIESLGQALDAVQSAFRGTGKAFQAKLSSGPGQAQSGTALLFDAGGGAGFVFVRIGAPLDQRKGPFLVELSDAAGNELRAGRLRPGSDGYLVRYIEIAQDLSVAGAVEVSRVVSVRIVDAKGWPVATGSVEPYRQPERDSRE